MKLSEAADIWKEHKPAAKHHQTEVEKAEKVLKEYFRKSGRTSFRGIAYTSTGYTQLDSAKARELLGDKAAQAEVPRTRETLPAI